MDDALAQNRWLLRVFTEMFMSSPSSRSSWRRSACMPLPAYAVTQHTREIGVRLALGAQPGPVIWLFLKRSLLQLALGLTIGLAGAVALGRVLQLFLVADERA